MVSYKQISGIYSVGAFWFLPFVGLFQTILMNDL